jgi:hypothetical protein
MEKLILILCVGIVLIACGSEALTPATPKPNPMPVPDTLMGVFVNAPGESIKGNVKIVGDAGSKSLVFDETFMANGPDLKIYLSVDAKASDYKSLGSLKATSGTQNYAIPGSVDLSIYGKYVVVWCQKYSVLFGTAELK